MNLDLLRFVMVLGPQHFDWLSQLAANCWDAVSVPSLVAQQSRGDLAVWEVSGVGLVLTKIISSPSGRELFLLGVVGKGMLKHGPAIKADLETIAKEYGCTKMGAEGRMEWAALRKVLGFKVVALRLQTEIDDG